MRNKNRLSLLLITLLFSSIFLIKDVFAESINSDEIITGNYQYSAIEGSNKQNKNTFIYKDSDFTKSSFKGSKSLETLSIQVAASSLSWYGKEIDQYEVDNSENDYNVKNFLNEMKFKSIESNKYYNLEKKENSVGVIVGKKEIIQDGEKYTLLAIIPRSAGYKQEWAGNFTIGDGDIHEGFKSARDEILRFIKKYIEKNNINGKLKVWTVGYSRGAAISNMVGGFFAGGGIDYFGNNVSITPEDVYCYTIGTPSSVKNGASKNTELSVSANRSSSDYVNDTVGDEFNYTKGGTLTVTDDVYNGIRNIISPDDAFSLLPPDEWGFTRYGTVINSYEGLYSIEEMTKELKSISEYVYGAYTTDNKIKEFSEKKFDLKTLSIVDKESTTTQIDFFKGRINGLISKISTNKIYNDEYQDAMKSALGTYGMVANLTGDTGKLETSDMVYPLIYTYLSYASDELQSAGRATTEAEAVTLTVEDLLTYFTETEIDNETFTIDDFVKTVLKFLADNETEPVSDSAVSGIMSLVPEQYKGLMSMFKIFSTNEDATVEEGLKAFIKACYYGSDPESAAYDTYKEPEKARQLLYITMLMSQGSSMPELQDLMMNADGDLDGHGMFEDFVEVMLEKTKQEKDDEGNIIKTYSNINELADEKLKVLLDNLLNNAIDKSEELYSSDYKNDLQKQVNGLKQNITKTKEALSGLFFYTEGGFDTVKSLESALTLVDNASLIAMPHMDEIYLALSRASNRYDDEYECIKGDNQSYNPLQDEKLSITFSFDHYLFNERGIVYIDGIEVSKENYEISKGSTVITLNNAYLKTLSVGNHTMTLKLDDKEASANFTITNDSSDNSNSKNNETNESNKKINNPSTRDNIMFYVSILGLSIVGISIIGLYLKKKNKLKGRGN